MNEFLAGVGVAMLVVAVLAVGAYFVLRRLFERAANRIADDMGRVLATLSARRPPAPRAGSAAAPDHPRRYTHLGAYAAAEGVSEDAARREFAASIERTARLMDSAVKLPVVGPVGLDAVLGLFPVAGDVISGAVAVSLIAKSVKYGVPREIIARMLGNVLFDLLLGTVPVAGDIADVWFRANTRNVNLLREYLAAEAPPRTVVVSATKVS